MKTFLRYISEEKEKSATFAFGRFNPPTVGHEKLIHKVEDEAKKNGGEAHIIASHSEGTSKNPLPVERKVSLLKKVAGKKTKVSSSSSEQPTLLHHLVKLHNSGVKHLTMVAGSDRVNEYNDLIHKYNGKESKHGTYNFKSIKVVSAGQRDPDAEGTEGMSGSKLRAKARSGEDIRPGLPKALHPHAKEIANHIRTFKEDIEGDD
jgi:phosphopantetheine adenylyltransferase